MNGVRNNKVHYTLLKLINYFVICKKLNKKAIEKGKREGGGLWKFVQGLFFLGYKGEIHKIKKLHFVKINNFININDCSYLLDNREVARDGDLLQIIRTK